MYKICSLFAGVGGIDLGFLETKECDVVYANEFDKYAVETYEKNFKTKVDCRDIQIVLEICFLKWKEYLRLENLELYF